jgi:hypothetical protein
MNRENFVDFLLDLDWTKHALEKAFGHVPDSLFDEMMMYLIVGEGPDTESNSIASGSSVELGDARDGVSTPADSESDSAPPNS